MKLQDKYGPQRLEKACTMANESNLCSYRHVKNILKNNMGSVHLRLTRSLAMNMFGANTITNRCEDMVMLFQPVVEKLRDTRLYGMLSGSESFLIPWKYLS